MCILRNRIDECHLTLVSNRFWGVWVIYFNRVNELKLSPEAFGWLTPTTIGSRRLGLSKPCRVPQGLLSGTVHWQGVKLYQKHARAVFSNDVAIAPIAQLCMR